MMFRLMQSRPRFRLYALALTHFMHDFYTGAWVLVLAAQVPLLNLTYTQAGIAQATYTFASAVAQPFFGSYFDKTGQPHLALWAVLITTAMVVGGAFAPTYAFLLLAAALAGLGSALFHSAALNNTKQVAGGRGKGRATAVFLLGGNGGFAAGAYVGGRIIDGYGLSAMTLPALLIILLAPFMIRWLTPYLLTPSEDGRPTRTTREYLAGGKAVWYPVTAYVAIQLALGLATGGISTYLPQYYESQGQTFSYAGTFTSLYLLFAAIGSFIGGTLSDRLPRRAVVAVSMALLAPFGYLTLRADGLLLITASIGLGLCSNLSLPILLLIGQEVLPGGKNGAGGFSFGLTFFTRAITAPFVGWLADEIGLLSALSLIGFVPLLGAVCVLALPADSRPARAAPALGVK